MRANMDPTFPAVRQESPTFPSEPTHTTPVWRVRIALNLLMKVAAGGSGERQLDGGGLAFVVRIARDTVALRCAGRGGYSGQGIGVRCDLAQRSDLRGQQVERA